MQLYVGLACCVERESVILLSFTETNDRNEALNNTYENLLECYKTKEIDIDPKEYEYTVIKLMNDVNSKEDAYVKPKELRDNLYLFFSSCGVPEAEIFDLTLRFVNASASTLIGSTYEDKKSTDD